MKMLTCAFLILFLIGCEPNETKPELSLTKNCSSPINGIWLLKDIIKQDENGHDVYDSNGNLMYHRRNAGYITLNSDCSGKFHMCFQDVQYFLPGDGTVKIKYLNKGAMANCPKAGEETTCSFSVSSNNESLTLGSGNWCGPENYIKNHDAYHGTYY